MNITTESASPTEVTLSVELDTEDVEPFITRSYQRLVGRVQIPGFRRGKAPRSIVERQLGRATLIQEALDFMVPETLEEALKRENLRAFMEPDLEILDVEPVSFKAVVPLEPVVELGDLSSFRLERQPVEVTDEQVGEVMERLRYDAAPWEPADRPVQLGDLLTLDVEGTIGGEKVIDDQGIDFVPQMDNPLPIPGFSVYLEGMSEGQEKEFTLNIPEEHHHAQYSGQECHLRAKVIAVKKKMLPELDDEFAKGVRDGYESLGALTDHLRQQLTESAEAASLRQLEQDGMDELLRTSTLQVSGLIYQRELDKMYEERERTIRGRSLDMDSYLSYIGKTEDEWREQLRPQSELRLNTYLVLRKLAQQEGIEVTPEEIEAEIDSMLAESGDAGESVRRVLSGDSARESIRSSLLGRKVLGRLVEIVEGRPAATDSPDDAKAEPGAADGSSAPDEPVDVQPLDPAPALDSALALDPEGTEEGADPHAE